MKTLLITEDTKRVRLIDLIGHIWPDKGDKKWEHGDTIIVGYGGKITVSSGDVIHILPFSDFSFHRDPHNVKTVTFLENPVPMNTILHAAYDWCRRGNASFDQLFLHDDGSLRFEVV